MKKLLAILVCMIILILSSNMGFAAPKKNVGKNYTPPPITTPSPTPIPIPSSTKEVLGFTTYYYTGDSSSYNSIVANQGPLDSITTFTYIMDGNGGITGLVPTTQLNYAKANGIKTYVMIANNFDATIAKNVLENSINRQTLINNLLNQIKQYGFNGVNIDIESISSTDRSYFNLFMIELYSTLQPLGYEVQVCVPAKTYDDPNNWNGAYDYKTLVLYADKIIIMAYDEHWSGGSAGPVASIGWVTNIVKYAITVIPNSKILLGTAAYGYDWASTGSKAVSINQAYNLINQYTAILKWDSVSQNPYFNYTVNGIIHTVWFENDQSVGYKLDLVNQYNLAGIAIWRLGLENANYWNTIKLKFNK